MALWGRKHNKKEQEATAPSVAAGSSTSQAANAVSPVAPSETLRLLLEEKLGRKVSFSSDGAVRQLAQAATNPLLLFSAGTVALGIATVLTAGTVHLALLAAASTGLVSKGSPATDWFKRRNKGALRLDQSGVDFLLRIDENDRVQTVQLALLRMPDGDIDLTADNLQPAYARLTISAAMQQGVAALRSPLAYAGYALLAAGFFLIAVTIIPEYIHSPTLRAAVAIVVVGVLLIGLSLVDSLKVLWKGSVVSRFGGDSLISESTS